MSETHIIAQQNIGIAQQNIGIAFTDLTKRRALLTLLPKQVKIVGGKLP